MENGKTQHIWILHIWCIFLSDDAITISSTYLHFSRIRLYADPTHLLGFH